MKTADVIAMTTTCAARYRRSLANIQPKVVIIEEAAEVLEAHVITSLSEGVEHLILIGLFLLLVFLSSSRLLIIPIFCKFFMQYFSNSGKLGLLEL